MSEAEKSLMELRFCGDGLCWNDKLEDDGGISLGGRSALDALATAHGSTVERVLAGEKFLVGLCRATAISVDSCLSACPHRPRVDLYRNDGSPPLKTTAYPVGQLIQAVDNHADGEYDHLL